MSAFALHPSAWAQGTPIRFRLDWRCEGPSALFLMPAAKGYLEAEKLAVAVDAGNGSGATVTRVASDAYATKQRVDASRVWSAACPPRAAERDIFAGATKK